MSTKPSDFDLDADFVRKLGELMKETDLSELEFSVGEKAIRMVRPTQQAFTPVATPLPVAAAPQAAPLAAPQAPAPVLDPTKQPGCITSPMVGTVYLAPEPTAAPFVKVGDSVKEGQTLLIIEAMKVMNPIHAAKSGIVKEIIVIDSSPVEFGEALILIE